jgi:nucleoside-diphosphate-sugar epimerase
MESQSTSRRVLVTGAAGALGRNVARALARRGHFVRAYDLVPTPPELGVSESIEGDLNDATKLRQCCEGVDTVVHLAAQADESKDFLADILKPNVLGLYRVCEAAREANVRRLVLASSIMVAYGLPWRERIITLADGVAPTCPYAMTKVYAEDMGRMYAKQYGMSCLAIRFGWLPRNDPHADSLQSDRAFDSLYLCTVDAGQAGVCAVEADKPAAGDFAAIYIASRRKQNIGVDLQPAKDVIGYEAQDAWPQNLSPHIRPREA